MASSDSLRILFLWSKKNYSCRLLIYEYFQLDGGGWKGLLRDEVSGHVMDIMQLEERAEVMEEELIYNFSSCSMCTVELPVIKNTCDILVSSEDMSL